MGDTFTVERSKVVSAPPDRVHDAIADFHRWEQWSPWHDIDPEMTTSYSGAESGVGAVYEWSGNRKAGQGRMEITGNTPQEVTVDLRFLKPFKAENTTTFRLAPEGDGTRVTWTMVGPRTFMTKVMGIFKSMDAMVGPDFEKGLDRLDAHLGS
jgi:hypothetical protein